MKNSEEQQLTQLFKVLNQAEAPVQTSWEVLSGKMEKSFWKFRWFHWNIFYLIFSSTIAVGAVLFMAYKTSLPSPQAIKKQKMDFPSNQSTNKEDVPEPLREHPDKIPVIAETPLINTDSNKAVITKPSSKTKDNNQSNNKKSDTIIAAEDPVTRIPDSTANHIKPAVQKVEKEPAGKKIIIFAEDTVVTVTDTIRTNKKPKKNKR